MCPVFYHLYQRYRLPKAKEKRRHHWHHLVGLDVGDARGVQLLSERWIKWWTNECQTRSFPRAFFFCFFCGA